MLSSRATLAERTKALRVGMRMNLGSHGPHRLVIATLAAGTIAACTGLLGFDGLRLAPGDAGPPPCVHRVPPPRPNVTDAGGDVDLIFAGYSIDFGNGFDDGGQPRYRSIGFDLDFTCTGEGQSSSCAEPSWANGGHADGIDGIDNAWAQFEDPSLPPPFIFAGDRAEPMLRIRGYSGEPDDDQVEVSLYVGLRVEPRDEAGPGMAQDAGGVALWDGMDRWTLHPDLLVSAADGAKDVNRPKFVDSHAYVSGGILVTRFHDMLLPSNPPFALVPVEQTVATARMVHVSPNQWELQQGVFAWRVKHTDGLSDIGWGPKSFTDPTPVCTDGPTYNSFKRRLCAFVDISSGPDNPSSPCDALSTAVGFVSKQALFGTIGSVTVSYPQCAPGIHPEIDSCDTLRDQ